MASRGFSRGRPGYRGNGRGGRGPYARGPQGGGWRGATRDGSGPRRGGVGSHGSQSLPSAVPSGLEDLFRQLTTTVTLLANRIEHLEKGGPDRNTGKPTKAVITPAGPPSTTTIAHTMSSNPNFAEVCKCLYRWVQLTHHQDNWKTLPKSLHERIKKLATDINPPMVDNEFRQRMNEATDDYANKMVRLVQEHIAKHKIDKEAHAGILSREDIDRATDVASKYLNTRLGRRLDANKRTALLKRASEFIGRMHKPPPHLPPVSVIVQGNGVSPITEDQWHTVTNKRKARSSPSSTLSTTPPTSNRFQSLAMEEEDDDDDDDVEPCSPPAVVRTRVLHSAKKSKPAPASRSTPPARPPARTASISLATRLSSISVDSRVKIFEGAKHTWSIQPNENTHSIIIGDSNLRKITKVPEGWEVHCLPDAHIKHVALAVSTLPQQPQDQYTVFIQAGINDRDNYDSTVEKEIEDLACLLAMNPSVRRHLHVGISVSSSLNPDQKENIKKINDAFKHCLEEKHCIPPLDPNDVEICRDDQYGIHHTSTTTEKIFHHIFAKDF